MRPKRWPASDRRASLLGPEGLGRGRVRDAKRKTQCGRYSGTPWAVGGYAITLPMSAKRTKGRWVVYEQRKGNCRCGLQRLAKRMVLPGKRAIRKCNKENKMGAFGCSNQLYA